MRQVGQALNEGRRVLAEAGIGNPGLDARLLLQAASGLEAADLISQRDMELSPEPWRNFRDFLERRARHEPVARILGRRAFWTFELELDRSVLVPRPETEILVEAVLAKLDGRREEALSILDLGTGSGAILLALLSEMPSTVGIGIDICPGAVRVARANADRLGLGDRAKLAAGDFCADLGLISGQYFDCIVSNPPYVRSRDCDRLSPEVSRFDPRLSLDGGEDGLDAYRVVARRITQHLRQNGLAAVEIGAGQAGSVRRLFRAERLVPIGSVKDLSGIDRALLFRKRS